MADLPTIFIANRGEIALRAVHAARALGMTSVIGVSAADVESLAARAADRCVVLGPAPAIGSYLNADILVHAAIKIGCTALYPGYGFLSERADFAGRCAENGIQFIGPTADHIAAVGDKLAARALAVASGVPVNRGSAEVVGAEAAVAEAEAIGDPVITKASAGGGGRRMVVAGDAAELAGAFDTAVAAATSAFGDGRLFLKHYVARARHIEVQAFGLGDGRVVHLHERDCSAQRRYQKMPGRITRWRAPAGKGIRVDSGFAEGCVVPPYHDSMIAELIVHADTRASAVDRLARALATFEIAGIATNIPFLRAVVAHPDFVANRVDTRWLERVMLPPLELAA